MFISDLLKGVISVLTVTNPPLYRYPYRNTFEAFRSDWKHIGSDIIASTQHFSSSQEGRDR